MEGALREMSGVKAATVSLMGKTAKVSYDSRKVDVLTLARISGHQDLSMLSRVYYRESASDIARRLD